MDTPSSQPRLSTRQGSHPESMAVLKREELSLVRQEIVPEPVSKPGDRAAYEDEAHSIETVQKEGNARSVVHCGKFAHESCARRSPEATWMAEASSSAFGRGSRSDGQNGHNVRFG